MNDFDWHFCIFYCGSIKISVVVSKVTETLLEEHHVCYHAWIHTYTAPSCSFITHVLVLSWLGKLLESHSFCAVTYLQQVDIHSCSLSMKHPRKWVAFFLLDGERVHVHVRVYTWQNPFLVGRSNWFSFNVEKLVLAICATRSSACVSGFAPLEHRTCSILVCTGTGGTAVVVT